MSVRCILLRPHPIGVGMLALVLAGYWVLSLLSSPLLITYQFVPDYIHVPKEPEPLEIQEPANMGQNLSPNILGWR